MAILVASTGSQTATINTEHTLATVTVSGNYVFSVSMENLVDGDTVELRIYTKVISGGTEKLAYFAAYTNGQATPNKYSVPVPSPNSVKITLKQTNGTGRVFPWDLMQVDA
jgi:hypothetical protein